MRAEQLPEPDVAVVTRADGGYARRHPTGTDAILVVELAWSSQDEDRKKAKIYARSGVSTYWLVDLAARKLEIHTIPGDEGYGDVTTLGDDATVALPGLAIVWSVRDVLGPAARSET
jgi:Uma2 family endonuclease